MQVGAESCELADALSRRYPSLEFVVQFHDDGPARTPTELTAAFAQLARANPRITVQQRRIGASQPIRDAAVYILRVPSVLSTVPDQVASWNRGASISQAGPLALRHLVLAELGAHLDVLRTNSAAMLILTARLRTAAGGDGLGSANGEPENQALSQMGELVLLQLTGHREVELGDVLKWVESVGDEAGKLSVVHRLASPGTADVAFVVRYTRAGAGC
ncbi:uncharacterized protein THITE_2114221 [Thermothielavioides terrestris NRRL 8126]|jgi:hypothetical protein|uniref:Uncharacterized protein n=1 Tax=Thermothielavioides terrestris (strain ATCC 38088 / NRRL 8126) TaxID=578455 RepID=G2QYQ4_THETT|nr:uncharacterized protein THITE_2114221 [Thermothielavioides terrestris NRRL 8126]AEO66246.1 hypothetical protein THITE_2114221 [Thermothielavioides terrestris NRRL 8126]